MEALERTSSVRNATEEVAEAIEADICVECEKAGKPRAFWKARQAGKGGLNGNFKGTEGNSWKVRTLCTADGTQAWG